jgi:small subunit ribosomal protein S2
MIFLGSQLMEDTKIIDQGDSATDETVEAVVETLSLEESKSMQEMMELGIFYGRSKSRTNPKMKPFIVNNRSGFGVINLRKTYSALEQLNEIVAEAVQKQGSILLVGTSPSVKGAVKEAADELELPYVTERWLGGTLTNFDTISKRIKYFRKLKEDKESGELAKYTKKEQLKLERELFKLEKHFGGIINLDKIPSLVFVADLRNNELAAKEAREVGVKIVGILNTDADPDLVDYGIPANDRNRKGVEFLVNKFKTAVQEERAKLPVIKENQEQPVVESKNDSAIKQD